MSTYQFNCHGSDTDTIPALERAYPCCGHYLRPAAFPCTWSCVGPNCVASGFPVVPTAGTLIRQGPCGNIYSSPEIPVYFVYDTALCPDEAGNRVGLQAFGPGMKLGAGWCNSTEFHANAECEVAPGINIIIEVHLP